MLNVKHPLILLILLTSFSGCTTTKQDIEQDKKINERAFLDILAKSSQTISDAALVRAASENYLRRKELGTDLQPNAKLKTPKNLGNRINITPGYKELEELIKTISIMTNYDFDVLGSRPSQPRIIKIDPERVNRTANSLIHEIGESLGSEILIEITEYPHVKNTNKFGLIEIKYL